MKKIQSVFEWIIRSVLLLSMMLSTFIQPVLKPAEAGFDSSYDWVFDEDFETGIQSPSYFDLELDENDHPHLAYFRDPDGTTQDKLVYRYHDGIQWVTGLELEAYSLNYVGLELDELGHPHIVFFMGTANQAMVYYIYFDGETWSSPLAILSPQSRAGYFASFELTSADVPMIAFYHETESLLALATFNGVNFDLEKVEGGNAYSYISMELDEADRPRIAYCEGSAIGSCTRLKHAQYDGAEWKIEILDDEQPSIEIGKYASLALDSNGIGHISYSNEDTGSGRNALMHAWQKESGWEREIVNMDGDAGIYCAIALDADNQPMIAYYDEGQRQLEFVWWDGSAWNDKIDPDAPDMGTYLNLALDVDDNPILAFWDLAESHISLAKYGPQPDLAITNFWVGEQAQLLASIRNDGEIAYQNEIGVNLYVDQTWAGEGWYYDEISPGETLLASLPEPACPGSAPTMEVMVCLIDGTDDNPTNDCLVETWACDPSPLIISEFNITDITTSGFSATWTTNKPADTVLKYTNADGRGELVYSDPDLVTSHSAVITGLLPHQVYYVRAYSLDAAGLVAKSDRATVNTLAGTGTTIPDPDLNFDRLDTRTEVYNLNATYLDTSSIERVEFYLDGVLVGTDYTPDGGKYTMQFSPSWNGYEREEFYDLSHRLTTEAVPFNPQIAPEVQESILEFQREESPIESQLLTPDAESTLSVVGTTVPSGTTLEISIFARQFEWECSYGGVGSQPNCEDVARPVSMVNFYINDIFKFAVESWSVTDDVYRYPWSMGGLDLGDYHIKAEVIATDGSTQVHEAVVHVVQGQTVLRTDRTITRLGNTFRVHLRLFNDVSSAFPSEINLLEEQVKGFQAVRQDFDTYSVSTSNSNYQSGVHRVILTPDDPTTLQPGENLEFYYYLIPVLIPDMEVAEYEIGTTTVDYSVGGVRESDSIIKISQVWDGGAIPLEASVANAFATSDYLLVTAPSALFDHFFTSNVDFLLADMAKLASLKQGVLAFWDPDLGKEILQTLLRDNSTWTDRLHPKFETRYGGYVLLVGETEVIPSFTTGPYTLSWNGSDGDQDVTVRLSDNPYANTDGNYAPDLLVGRVLGDTPHELRQAILNSIDTHENNAYERAEAYVASGMSLGDAYESDPFDWVTDKLTDYGYTVGKHHWKDEAILTSTGLAYTQYDGLAHADMDGDGIDELVWVQDSTNTLFFIDGFTGTMKGSFPLDYEDGDSLAAGDVDNDGVPEIIIGDRNDTIRTLALDGTLEASFAQDFSAWEMVAVGDVLSAHAGNEIIMADDNNFMRIFSHTGTELIQINISLFGYDFADHDIMRVGDVLGDTVNPTGVDEIVFTDLHQDKIVVMAGNGVIYHVINREFNEGDNLEVGNTNPGTQDEIILADRDNNIYIYTPQSGDHSIRFIYVDWEAFDGLLVSRLTDSVYADIFHFDRGDRLALLDRNYPNNPTQIFENSVAGADLIWFKAHGNPAGMDPTISSANFPVDFAGAHPIVNAWSCSTGDYEGYGGNEISKAFLQSGAGIYLGATEVSFSGYNDDVSYNLYDDYWQPGHTFSQSLAQIKNDRITSSFGSKFWKYFVDQYNVYGDPKLDINNSAITTQQVKSTNSLFQDSLVLDLPMYTVTENGGIDTVRILADDVLGTHNGTHVLEQGAYQVPIYIHTMEIPAGTQVQDITLAASGEPSVALGLNLPLVDLMPASMELQMFQTASSQSSISSTPGHDWSPNFESPFEWSVVDNIEGGSVLTLVLHPFYYDPAAQYSEYTQHFEFAIETISTTVTITGVGTDKAQYSPGDDVLLSLVVTNTGDPLDVVVSTTIRQTGAGEPVDGFYLTGLTNLAGTAMLDLAWNWMETTAIPAGDYTIDIIVENMAGQRLSQRSVNLSLGVTAGNIDTFTVDPTVFQPGDMIAVDMVFSNSGDRLITGEAVIQVLTLNGEMVSEFLLPITGLASGSSVLVEFEWNSTGAVETDYKVVGYVRYASQATPLVVQPITTIPPTIIEVFLPLVKK